MKLLLSQKINGLWSWTYSTLGATNAISGFKAFVDTAIQNILIYKARTCFVPSNMNSCPFSVSFPNLRIICFFLMGPKMCVIIAMQRNVDNTEKY